jgi:hypothetical protein
MDGLRIILLGVGIVILIMNFFINSGNLIKIISYCFKTNTIGEYWELFFKSSVSGKAIISSIIGFVLAVIVFIIITPFILVKKYLYGKKISTQLEEGLFFEYEDLNFDENIFYNSNISKVSGLQIDKINVTGKIRIDAIMLISDIDKICKTQNKEFTYSVMDKIKINDTKEAIVPIILSIDGEKLPTYFIFNETHKKQFSKITNTLYNQGYKKNIYFSTIKM